MIPYSGPKLSDLYTLSQSKLLENHTPHSSTYLDSPYVAVRSPPLPSEHGTGIRMINHYSYPIDETKTASKIQAQNLYQTLSTHNN